MIRLAIMIDLKGIMKCINDAKELFRSVKSDQWQAPTGYPDENNISDDIVNQRMYVFEDDNIIKGCMAVLRTPEPTYLNIYEGAWLNSDEYWTVHRIAVNKKYYHQEVATEMMKFVEVEAARNQVFNIKIDTKIENKNMRGLADKLGYVYCGIIYLCKNDLDPKRLAYQKVIEKEGK